MNPVAVRAVFDCNIFLQALSAPHGPAGKFVQLSFDTHVNLFISTTVLDELREVTSRQNVIAKLRLVEERVQEFFEAIESSATLLHGFPEPFIYPRDAQDAHYVNLALAPNAKLIVSRDKDLLDLMNLSNREAKDFQTEYPALRILGPVEFVREFAG